MKRNVAIVMCVVGLLSLSQVSAAEDQQESNGFYFGYESTFFQFSQEGGVTDVSGNAAEFSHDSAPRIEIGYDWSDTVGTRMRVWDYDEDAVSSSGYGVEIDTCVLDVEIYELIDLSEKFDWIASVGARLIEYQDWRSTSSSKVKLDYEGLGLVLGSELRRELPVGALYLSGRFGVQVGDMDLNISGSDYSAQDHIATQTEVGLGYEVALPKFQSGHCLSMNVGLEWQEWSNIAMADTSFGGIGNDDVCEDAGFWGFVLGARLDF